eukprot:CAMPEP_0195509316 /NCGR_PEP_ID=MMETSP0794_2-20130614/2280_1 /TAXON_ID=515487 /ORGANISM="Stephanopyxis turris, Strain CCMP 815" /LENGTH=110 /DNA_ID=CAMNT_0040636495 /DNA_START=46 /DNA_END=378 /DNA_ORIENTATION=+
MTSKALYQRHHRPTQMERAFAAHLLQHRFNNPLFPDVIVDAAASLNLSANDAVLLKEDEVEHGIRISGRDGVGFLTQSGIARNVLRVIWNLADPEGYGTLMCRYVSFQAT